MERKSLGLNLLEKVLFGVMVVSTALTLYDAVGQGVFRRYLDKNPATVWRGYESFGPIGKVAAPAGLGAAGVLVAYRHRRFKD